jgi:hypothetical protein
VRRSCGRSRLRRRRTARARRGGAATRERSRRFARSPARAAARSGRSAMRPSRPRRWRPGGGRRPRARRSARGSSRTRSGRDRAARGGRPALASNPVEYRTRYAGTVTGISAAPANAAVSTTRTRNSRSIARRVPSLARSRLTASFSGVLGVGTVVRAASRSRRPGGGRRAGEGSLRRRQDGSAGYGARSPRPGTTNGPIGERSARILRSEDAAVGVRPAEQRHRTRRDRGGRGAVNRRVRPGGRGDRGGRAESAQRRARARRELRRRRRGSRERIPGRLR